MLATKQFRFQLTWISSVRGAAQALANQKQSLAIWLFCACKFAYIGFAGMFLKDRVLDRSVWLKLKQMAKITFTKASSSFCTCVQQILFIVIYSNTKTNSNRMDEHTLIYYITASLFLTWAALIQNIVQFKGLGRAPDFDRSFSLKITELSLDLFQ